MPLTQVQGGMILPSTTLTTPIVATTMGVGGATPAASGSGITFPATQSASSDANTLDDYEEGTWTPTLGCTTTNPTVSYSTRAGRYTKVGRLVTAQMRITLSSTSGGSGQVQIQGLPFVNGSSDGGGCFVRYMDSWITNGPTAGYVQGSASTGILHYFSGSASIGNLFAANIGNITDVGLVFVYESA